MIASLGRYDRLIASEELDGLLRSLAKFSDNLRVVEAVRTSRLAARTTRQWGPALVFGRLWAKQALPDLLLVLSQERKFGFSVERASFAIALQRLCAPGSGLAGSEWFKTVGAPGFEDLALRLEVDLQQRLEEREIEVSWPDLMRDLSQVQSALVELDGRRYQMRTDLVGSAHQAFAAARVRAPSAVTLLGPIS